MTALLYKSEQGGGLSVAIIVDVVTYVCVCSNGKRTPLHREL